MEREILFSMCRQLLWYWRGHLQGRSGPEATSVATTEPTVLQKQGRSGPEATTVANTEPTVLQKQTCKATAIFVEMSVICIHALYRFLASHPQLGRLRHIYSEKQ
jgi:hypothetical protein